MAKDFFSAAQQEQIIQAIHQAELQTSGEIKAHVESQCPTPDVMERAKEVFIKLNMHQTELRNGVLFYLSTEDHQFAILGDQGIYTVVPQNFWGQASDTMRDYFKRGELADGLCAGIRMAGELLQEKFPRTHNDINELPDDISFGS
jgi:uncharacterized membrane protein